MSDRERSRSRDQQNDQPEDQAAARTESEADLERVGQAVMAAEQFLAAIVVKPAAWHRFGLPPHIQVWLKELASRRSTVVACLGAPQGLEPFAGAEGLVCTMSDVPVSQQALVDALAR